MWPSTVPTTLHEQCLANNTNADSIISTIEKFEALPSLLESLSKHRYRRLLVGDVQKGRFYAETMHKGVSTKSEELALALKEKGNAFFAAKNYLQAIEFYNKMICVAKEGSTRFIGISNKAACLYGMSQSKEAIELDEYLLKTEQNMVEARKAKITARIEKHQKHLPIQTFSDALGLLDMEDETDYPQITVSHSEESGNGVYAAYSIAPSQSVFGAPISPYASTMHQKFESQRCDTCFSPLIYSPIIPCKSCCAGFCSDKCATPHTPYCNVEWLSMAPPLSRLGFKTYLTSLNDPQNAAESVSLLNKLPNGPADARDVQDIYAPDLSIINQLLTNESKVNFGSVLLPSALDAVLISELYAQKSGSKLDPRALLSHILIANSNAFEVVTYEPEEPVDLDANAKLDEFTSLSIGFAQYGLPSLLNHSCEPNTINSYMESSNRITFRAIKPISKGEQVFHCYGPSFLANDLAERQKLLRDKYCFDCHCEACELEKLKPLKRNIFESEHELDDYLTNYAEQNINNPENSLNARSTQSLISELKKCSAVIGNLSGETGMPNFPALLPALGKWLELGEKRYQLLFSITKGEGFGIQREGMPILPESRNLQVAFAAQHDQLAQVAAMLQKYEKAYYHCKKSVQVLEVWYPPYSIELGREYEKLLGIIFPHLLLSKNGQQYLDEAWELAKKTHNCFKTAFGPRDKLTKGARQTLEAVHQIKVNLQLKAMEGRKKAR